MIQLLLRESNNPRQNITRRGYLEEREDSSLNSVVLDEISFKDVAQEHSILDEIFHRYKDIASMSEGQAECEARFESNCHWRDIIPGFISSKNEIYTTRWDVARSILFPTGGNSRTFLLPGKRVTRCTVYRSVNRASCELIDHRELDT